MKNTNDSFARQLAACALIACFAAHPVFAGTTDISQTPLATSSADNVRPNVLFTLDDSGSMDWDYLPDYVNDNGKCMATSTGTTNCLASDPPYAAGGQFGFNGVGYDPNVFYAPGLKADGTTVLTAPLDILNLREDAYDTSGTPSTIDLTADIDHRRFCNSAGACKRNGADAAGALVSGSDASGNAMAAGQFPYRTNAANSSTVIFGLPEMMSIGSFTRSGSTVTVTTVESHGLTTSDRVYVPTTTSGLNVTCVAVTTASTNTFTYTSGSSGTLAATNGSYRKCVGGGTWTRSGSTVTVTSVNHGLQTNDLILVDSSDNNQDKLSTAAAVTVTGSDTFTYAGSSSGSTTSGSATWVRSGLYNVVQTTSGGPLAYRITPFEYCSDANLTTCTLTATPGTAPTGFPFPAYARFCKTQAEAYAPGLVTGTSGSPATARCQAKFINSLGLSYTFPRFGRFSRENLTTGGSYPNRPNRSECASVPNCTGDEEMQNYARWYTYYRTRMQMMKTAAGRTFLGFIGSPGATPPRPNSMRLGFITIHAADGGSVASSKYLKILDFDTTHAGNFYTKFYSISPGGGTPLQEALSRAGWIFAGKLGSGLTSGIPAGDDPMQSSCQRNFSIFTTDGYWNGALGKTISGGAIGNRDNVDPTIIAPYTSPMVDRATTVTYDGSPNTIIRTITDNVETQTICGQGLPDQCGCTRTGRKRIRDIIDSTVRKIITTDGVVTSDTTTTSSTSSTIGSCSSTTPTITLSPNPKTTTTDVTQPASSASSDTLADVAMYYYMTDLRGGTDFAGNATGPSTSPNTTPAGGDVATNNVPAKSGARDFTTHQHMVTFTLGLADGYLRYQNDYDTSPTGSFADIKNAAAGPCFWVGGATCNWPVPTADDPSALDDLWHAAVNGRGQFFQALNATDLSRGLANALTALNAQVASAAASATSSPNVTQTDNQIFSTTYETNTWSGKVFSQTIDIATGTVNPTIQWQADERLLTLVGPSADSRKILTFNPVAGDVMDFTFTNIAANATGSEKDWFQNRCSPPLPTLPLSQCGTLPPVLLAAANDGDNLLNFLRGQTGLEGSVFRDRIVIDTLTNVATQSVLGDTISAKPAFVRNPVFSYGDLVTPNYASYKSAQALRAPRVYVGANDGYLHAFDGSTGDEAWAYAPRFLLAGMYLLADAGYGKLHTFFVDGSPETGDVFDGVSWRTILVGGASGGGRGFYALDITNPTAPRALWEFCSDASVCNNSAVGLRNDPDLGYSYGNPAIGKRASDGKWVVVLTSGLNNVPSLGGSTGDGQGYFYVLDAITGAVLNKVSTGVGSVVTPSGLMKTSAFFDSALTDATFRYVYGGDQLGNVWRLDLSTVTPTVLHLASLQDGAGRAQPITTRPSLTHIGLDRILFFGTGRYIGTADLSDPGLASGIAYQQSLYAIKDKDSDYGSSSLRTVGNLVQRTFTKISPTERGIAAGATLDWSTSDGWFIDFDPPVDPTPGERVNIDPRLVLGTLVVATNIPTVGAGACSVGGTSKIYAFDFRNGTAVATSDGGVVGRSLGGTITVGMAIVQLPSGAIHDIITGADTGKTGYQPPIAGSGAGMKRFSYRER